MQGRGVRGQAALWAHNHGSGVLPSPRQERSPLESLPKAWGTGDKEATGIPRMARGVQGPRPQPPSPSSPSHSIEHIADSHLGAYSCGEARDSDSEWAGEQAVREKEALRGKNRDPGIVLLGQQSVEGETRPKRAPLAQPGGMTAATGPHNEGREQKKRRCKEKYCG